MSFGEMMQHREKSERRLREHDSEARERRRRSYVERKRKKEGRSEKSRA
jgi:hypothetical protein